MQPLTKEHHVVFNPEFSLIAAVFMLGMIAYQAAEARLRPALRFVRAR